jgi:hypothetical protein
MLNIVNQIIIKVSKRFKRNFSGFKDINFCIVMKNNLETITQKKVARVEQPFVQRISYNYSITSLRFSTPLSVLI